MMQFQNATKHVPPGPSLFFELFFLILRPGFLWQVLILYLKRHSKSPLVVTTILWCQLCLGLDIHMGSSKKAGLIVPTFLPSLWLLLTIMALSPALCLQSPDFLPHTLYIGLVSLSAKPSIAKQGKFLHLNWASKTLLMVTLPSLDLRVAFRSHLFNESAHQQTNSLCSLSLIFTVILKRLPVFTLSLPCPYF